MAGEKIQACRQNSDLHAANSEELRVILKGKKIKAVQESSFRAFICSIVDVDGPQQPQR